MQASNNWGAATVHVIRDVTPTVREFEIIPDSGAILLHDPGAHLQIQIVVGQGADASVQTRHYSLIGEPNGSYYRIAVKRMDGGRGGSLAMWELAVGDRLQISDPKNFFTLDTTAPAYLMVAGGIGITPLVLMAQRLAKLAEKTGVSVRMLYGARTHDELAYLAELQAILGDRLQEYTGSTPIDFVNEISILPARSQIYTCGPAPMLEALKQAWALASRPIADLRFETFGSSGRFAAESFHARIPRLDIEIVVPKSRTLLDALELAGVQTLNDCRRGECGLCAMDIISIKGQIDHRDVFLSEHEKQQNTRICACVSRVIGEITLDCAYRSDA